MHPIFNTAAVVAATAALLTAAAEAQPITPTMSPKGSITGPEKFPEQGGSLIFKAACQGCHMPNGTGASGAGTYPSLAKNSKLGTAGYPVTVVLNGNGAMPPFKSMLDDQQVAAVVTYIRTNFGNNYPAKVTPAQVKAVRGS